MEAILISGIEPTLAGLGFSLVDVRAVQTKRNYQVLVVIYRGTGLSLEDCSLVTRTILPKIELLLDSTNLRLEVSSPGIERNLRSFREFGIFVGRGVRVMRKDDNDWIGGVIESACDDVVRLHTKTGQLEIPFKGIKKARLDHSMGGD